MTTRRPWGRLVILAVALSTLAVVALPALEAVGAEKAVKLPDPLTKEAIRELVSRLSDAEVRELLLAQLDKAAAPADAKADGSMAAGPRGGHGPRPDGDRRACSGPGPRCPRRSVTRFASSPRAAGATICSWSAPSSRSCWRWRGPSSAWWDGCSPASGPASARPGRGARRGRGQRGDPRGAGPPAPGRLRRHVVRHFPGPLPGPRAQPRADRERDPHDCRGAARHPDRAHPAGPARARAAAPAVRRRDGPRPLPRRGRARVALGGPRPQRVLCRALRHGPGAGPPRDPPRPARVRRGAPPPRLARPMADRSQDPGRRAQHHPPGPGRPLARADDGVHPGHPGDRHHRAAGGSRAYGPRGHPQPARRDRHADGRHGAQAVARARGREDGGRREP